jgi:hypothetical protein
MPDTTTDKSPSLPRGFVPNPQGGTPWRFVCTECSAPADGTLPGPNGTSDQIPRCKLHLAAK